MSDRPRRVPKSVTVVRTEQVAPQLVRVVVTGDDLAQIGELEFTDHYVKLLFPRRAPTTRGRSIPNSFARNVRASSGR